MIKLLYLQKFFVKYSDHQVKSKIKKSLSKYIYGMCVIKVIIYSTFVIASYFLL